MQNRRLYMLSDSYDGRTVLFSKAAERKFFSQHELFLFSDQSLRVYLMVHETCYAGPGLAV